MPFPASPGILPSPGNGSNAMKWRLGGEALAQRFVALAEELDRSATLPVDRLAAMQKEALAAARALEGDVARRWLTLTDQIGRRRYMGR